MHMLTIGDAAFGQCALPKRFVEIPDDESDGFWPMRRHGGAYIPVSPQWRGRRVGRGDSGIKVFAAVQR
jgi:hypothetical protein